MNARTFAASFFPGADSTPLETSTANGRTLRTASRDIFRRQPAGEKNRFAKFLRRDRQFPVEFFARAAEAASANAHRAKTRRSENLPVACNDSSSRTRIGLQAHQAELRAKFRRFVAVKLQQVQPAFTDGAHDQILGRIHKHADALDERRQRAGNFRRLRQRDDGAGFFRKNSARSCPRRPRPRPAHRRHS